MAGWTPGVHLTPQGRGQAERLTARLARLPIRKVYSSPLERAVETAGPIARAHNLAPEPLEDLGELHLGAWEGATFEDLNEQDAWRRFNSYRSGTRPPGGELMIEAQTRMVRRLDCLRARHAGELVAAVSHADPLRAAIAFYLGAPLDMMLRFEIHPASVSVVELGDDSCKVLCLNETGDVPL